MQPPVSNIAIVENAIAFIWLIGNGVMSLSTHGLTSQRPPIWAYHVPAQRKYSFESTQPFGLPVVPDV
jgi:hypothetical protein